MGIVCPRVHRQRSEVVGRPRQRTQRGMTVRSPRQYDGLSVRTAFGFAAVLGTISKLDSPAGRR
jgi:hypothetical protein